MAEISLNNAWIESYLDALLSKGLSSEHIQSSGASSTGSRGTSKLSALNDEQSITTRYYVNQILSLDEGQIRDAWTKASRPSRSGAAVAERDARLEQLSWRVWAMKRRRAQVQADLEAERREVASDLLRKEEEDEADITTLMTIDELNSTAMEAFDIDGDSNLGDPKMSVLHEEDEHEATDEEQVPPVGQEQSWTGVKDLKGAGMPAVPPAGLKGTALAPSGISPGGSQASGSKVNSTQTAPAAPGMTGKKESNLATPFASTPNVAAMNGVLSSAFAAPPPGIPGIRTAGPSGGNLTAPTSPLAGMIHPASSIQPPTATAAAAPDPLLVSRFPRLYIILISLHGLVRGERMELGKDPDTGGQVKYVVELAKALGQFPSVARVDLLTRLIADPKVDESYAVPEERLHLPPLPPGAAAVAAAAASAYGGEAGQQTVPGSPAVNGTASANGNGLNANNSARGAFIVRLPCGPRNVYLRKEDLWPHVREFSDRAIAHAHATLARLQEGGEGPCELYVVHGHYADAGEVAAQVASSLGVDCVLTGHSLGRNKKEHLLKSGNVSMPEIEATYKISRRIEAEERALDAASVVFTSTQQEVAEQWGLYDGFSDELSSALQLRPCRGYHVPKMAVIPPGLDFSNLKVSMPNDPWEEVLGTAPMSLLQSAGNSEMVTGAGQHKTLTPRHSGSQGGIAAEPAGPQPTSPAIDAPNTPSRAARIQAAGVHAPPILASDAATPPNSFSMPHAQAQQAQHTLDNNSVRAAVADALANEFKNHGNDHFSTRDAPSRPLPPRASASGALSRRPSHTGISVAATPRGPPTPHQGLGQINPSKLAAMMVGDSEPPIWREINRFLRHPGRPVILAMSRPDAKKNVLGLVHAFGKSRVLRDLANLVLVLGNRDVIDGMAPGSARVLSDVLKLIDMYDLYGQVAYPKRHSQSDISDIYLLAAATRGVFVNVALQEPFGLTLIEAAAHGAPIVATTHGGPVDIVATLKNGMLVDPANQREIAEACVSLITSQKAWDEASENGRQNITAYSWPSHCARYLRTVQDQKANQYVASRNRVGLLYGGGQPDGKSGNKTSNIPPAARVRHTLSLSYDDLGMLARAIAAEANIPGTPSNGGVPASISAADMTQVSKAPSPPAPSSEAGSTKETSKETPKTSRPTLEACSDPSFSHFAIDAAKVQDALLNLQQTAAEAQENPEKQPDLNAAAEAVAAALPALSLSLRAGSLPPGWCFVQSPSGKVKAKPNDPSAMPMSPKSATSAIVAALSQAAAAASNSPAPKKDLPTPADSKNLNPASELSAMDDSAVSTGKEAGANDNADGRSTVSCKGRFQVTAEQFGDKHDGAFPERSAASASAGVVMSQPELQPRIQQHQDIVVFNFNTIADVKYTAPLLRQLLDGGSPADDSPASDLPTMSAEHASNAAEYLTQKGNKEVGVGVLCNWSNKQLRALLEREGINPLDLDFTVCNAGSMIWQTMGMEGLPALPNGKGPEKSGRSVSDKLPGASFLCDDDWETHIDFRWDERVTQQVLRRILDSKVGWGKLHLIRPNTGASATAAQAQPAAGTTSVAVRLSPQSSPFHYMIDVEIRGATGSKAPLSISEVANQMLVSVRRKLRLSGVRAQVTVTPRETLPDTTGSNIAEVKRARRGAFSSITNTLSSIAQSLTSFGSAGPDALVASDGDASRSVTVHITPLRCSRALAIRHLATRFRRPLTAWTLVACGATAESNPASSVHLSSSDGDELVGGQQQVIILPAQTIPAASGDQKPALPIAEFPLDVSVFQAATASLGSLQSAAGDDKIEGDVNHATQAAAYKDAAKPRVTVVTP